jgi:hypothetical protein
MPHAPDISIHTSHLFSQFNWDAVVEARVLRLLGAISRMAHE